MKRRHVFLIWLLADVLFEIFKTIYYYEFRLRSDFSYEMNIFWVEFFGVVCGSLPSLFILLCFNFMAVVGKTRYLGAFSLAILGINALYFVFALNFNTYTPGILLLFTGTTVAGFLSLLFFAKIIKVKPETTDLTST